jgi:hypothetical protein
MQFCRQMNKDAEQFAGVYFNNFYFHDIAVSEIYLIRPDHAKSYVI